MLLIFLFPFAVSLQSQNFAWIDAIETGYAVNPNLVRYTVKSSPDGTTWFVGMKEQVLNYTNMMGDQFVIRYDAEGNKLEEYLIEGALIINAMETDEAGNLYLGGVAHDSVSFDDLQVYRDTYYYPLITKLETGMTTGVSHTYSGPETLILSPNPVKEGIKLPFVPGEIVLFQVYSFSGNKLLEGKHRKHITLENMPVGMYYLKLHLSDGRTFGGKFIVAE